MFLVLFKKDLEGVRHEWNSAMNEWNKIELMLINPAAQSEFLHSHIGVVSGEYDHVIKQS